MALNELLAYGSESEQEEEQEERRHERGEQGEDDEAGEPLAALANGGEAQPNLYSTAPDISLTPPQSTLGPDTGGRQGDQAEQQQASTAQREDSKNVWNQLPPELRTPPPGPCSPAVEAKLLNIIATSRKQNRSFIDSLRKHRQYSNPDLLQQLVKIYNLKEAGSSFPQDTFNLDALPREDDADQLLRQLDRLQESRRQQRAEAKPGQASIPFERGAGPLGTLPPSGPGGIAKGPGGGSLLQVAQLREQAERNAAAMMATAGKRSKWDSTK